ncbi:COG3650 family protein [Catalinimonas niigatensis]|uniref:COG3650 family protein n=1 Tax=Catalinimonas niigatensis TaxID=1397264 RepID=UPI002664EBF7|nr:hypothetical protein [Catalinimonas niigatensis]WPP51106.1 hypothetical protein PZB72_01695 [Catalinimonas niigatensis]
MSAKFGSLSIPLGEAMFVRINATVDSMSHIASKKDIKQQILVHEVIETSTYQGQSPCTLSREKTFKFTGNEPFWSLTIFEDSIVFNHFEQEPIAFPYTDPQWKDSVWVINIQKDDQILSASISEKECNDTMSDIRYSMSIMLQTARGRFERCGGWTEGDITHQD